jgi:hypothetical protein
MKIFKKRQDSLSIELEDAQGETLRRWEPLSFPAVRRRLVDVDELVTSGGHVTACRSFEFRL